MGRVNRLTTRVICAIWPLFVADRGQLGFVGLSLRTELVRKR